MSHLQPVLGQKGHGDEHQTCSGEGTSKQRSVRSAGAKQGCAADTVALWLCRGIVTWEVFVQLYCLKDNVNGARLCCWY